MWFGRSGFDKAHPYWSRLQRIGQRKNQGTVAMGYGHRIHGAGGQVRLPSLHLASDFERLGYRILTAGLPIPLLQSWHGEALRLMKYAHTVRRSSGSDDLVYRVMTGDAIRRHWPELYAFYQDERTVKWVREITGRRTLAPSKHVVSGVNLNILDSVQAVYRWHFDAVPYTVLIYLTETVAEDGGALELVPGCRHHQMPDLSQAEIVTHYPRAGTIVVMDGTRCYHRVAPLLRPALRLSIPLVYTNQEAEPRPRGLDSYLYQLSV